MTVDNKEAQKSESPCTHETFYLDLY